VLDTGWEAQLKLSFVRDGARSVLHERVHTGPLRVQRPFYPEGDGVCHVYVLHPPGGLVGGDRVHLDVSAEAGVHVLLTTPAAGKLYRSAGSLSEQMQTLRVAAGALLEYLPQETIAFDGAHGQLSTRVELSGDARFMGWEMLCLGRPAAQERFTRGTLGQSIELSRDGRVSLHERGWHVGGSAALSAPWGLANWPVLGTFVCAAHDAASCIERAREVALPSVGLAAMSGWDDLLVARYLGPSVEQGRAFFVELWSVLRPVLLGREACAPRIWRT
jgi:urease accessory protein